jgi:hypothetical protein
MRLSLLYRWRVARSDVENTCCDRPYHWNSTDVNRVCGGLKTTGAHLYHLENYFSYNVMIFNPTNRNRPIHHLGSHVCLRSCRPGLRTRQVPWFLGPPGAAEVVGRKPLLLKEETAAGAGAGAAGRLVPLEGPCPPTFQQRKVGQEAAAAAARMAVVGGCFHR